MKNHPHTWLIVALLSVSLFAGCLESKRPVVLAQPDTSDASSDTNTLPGGSLCRPCFSTSDCGDGAICALFSPEKGSFCSQTCVSDVQCPPHFSCQEKVTPDGTTLALCLPPDLECPCDEEAVADQLSTACYSSSCVGQRSCSETGLSLCDAAPAADDPLCQLDADSDGRPDDSDNCPNVANSDQADGEGDGIGDVCDPPETPTFTHTDPASPSTSMDFSLHGACERASLVRIFSGEDCDGEPLAESDCSEGGDFVFERAASANDAATFSLRLNNPAGLPSPCSKPISYVHDNVAPDFPTLSTLTPQSPAQDPTPLALGTAEEGAEVRIHFLDCEGPVAGQGTSEDFSAGGIAISAANNQPSLLVAEAIDAAGNSSGCDTRGVLYIHDDIAPTAPTVTKVSPMSPGNQPDVTFSFGAEPGVIISAFANSECAGEPVAQSSGAGIGALQLTVGLSENATQEFWFQAHDAALNVGPCTQSSWVYVHDNEPPSDPSGVSFSPSSPSATEGSPVLSGTSLGATLIELHEDDACADEAPWVLNEVTEAGAFSFNIGALSPSEAKTFSIVALDEAGNKTACVGGLDYLFDPDAPVFTGEVTATGLSKDSIQLSWTAATDASAISYEVCVSTSPDTCANSFTTENIVSDGLSLTLGGLDVATRYWVSVRATDALGNTSAASAVSSAETFGDHGGVEVAVGTDHRCVLASHGRVSCAGSNTFGQLGDGGESGASAQPQPVPALDAVRVIVAGDEHTCALRANGEVWCWGQNSKGQCGQAEPDTVPAPMLVTGLPLIRALASGSNHMCALSFESQLWCWGRNQAGQTGQAMTSATVPAPALVNDSVVQQVVAGESHTCTLSPTGEVLCFGSNEDDELGGGPGGPTPMAVAVLDSDEVIQLASGQLSTCALSGTGEPRCWGKGAFKHKPGGGAQSDAFDIPLSDVVDVAFGDSFTCYLAVDGHVTCYFSGGSASLDVTWTTISGHASQLCGRSSQGQVKCVQTPNSAANALNITPLPVYAPRRPGVLVASGLSTGWVRSDGTVGLWGTLSTPDAEVPVVLSEESLANFTGATSLTLGTAHLCVRRADATVHCAGDNTYGQLGTGNVTASDVLVEVPNLSNVTQVVAGERHTCALLSDGPVACWGNNELGQFVLSQAPMSFSPVLESPVCNFCQAAILKQVGAGRLHGCLLSTQGAVLCEGDDTFGQAGGAVNMGAGDATIIRDLATEADSNCVVRYDGKLFCWGRNDTGQLAGASGLAGEESPTQIPVATATQSIHMASHHACALTDSGAVQCWGDGSLGQLGTGDLAQGLPLSVNLPGMELARAIATGDTHSCALLASGRVACWGTGDAGQLGLPSASATPQWVPNP